MRAADYIARTSCLRFEEGRTDCALWAASFWAEATGTDPAASLRGTYATAFERRRIVMAAGGLERLCRRLMAGWRDGETREGICVARVSGQTVCGILSGGRLFLKTARGVWAPERFTILAGWGV